MNTKQDVVLVKRSVHVVESTSPEIKTLSTAMLVKQGPLSGTVIIVSSARTKRSQKTFREIQISEPRVDLLSQLLVGEEWLVNSVFLKRLKDK